MDGADGLRKNYYSRLINKNLHGRLNDMNHYLKTKSSHTIDYDAKRT